VRILTGCDDFDAMSLNDLNFCISAPDIPVADDLVADIVDSFGLTALVLAVSMVVSRLVRLWIFRDYFWRVVKRA